MAASSKPPGSEDRRRTRARDEKGRMVPFEPTEEQRRIVMAAKLCGMENDGIAIALNLDRDTLTRHFQPELALAGEHIEARVAGNLLGMALNPEHKDSQRAGEFVLRSKFKWRTRDELAHTFGIGAGAGEPQPDESDVKPAKITVEFVTTRPKGLPGAPPEDQ